MAGKVKIQPASRVGLDPLVDMAEQLRTALPGWHDTTPVPGRQRVLSDIAHDLRHLAHHDGDGFLTVSLGDEVMGFGAAYVRSRHLIVTQPWIDPEVEEPKVLDVLLRRMLAFGERAGVSEASAHLLGGAADHAAFLRFGFRPRFPIYRLSLSGEQARLAGQELAKLHPGRELTEEGLQRRAGSADLERLDRLARGFVRPMDHEYWLAVRGLRLATVREGQRIAAYAYGGPGQCGPVAAATPEAALAGLGWALQFAAAEGTSPVTLLVPATFESALEHLLDAGAACIAVSTWMTRQPGAALERYVLAAPALA